MSKPGPNASSGSQVRASSGWLNRSTIGLTLASLFSDVSHELGTAVLPALLLSLGAGSAALGWIEGSADGLAALSKLWGGVMADRVERRKPLASIGYLVTALGIAAIGVCSLWWQVLLCRVSAWIGRGSRTAPRDVLVVEATAPEMRGKAFGMERAGDALGAVIGPLLAIVLLARGVEERHVVFASLIPGLFAFLAITLLVSEKPNLASRRPPSLRGSFAATGKSFHTYLAGILLFGCGDFSRTLLILYATRSALGTLFSWSAASFAIALYVLHNAVSSAAALPLGALSDRVGVRPVVVGGYIFAAAVTASFGLLPATPALLITLFVGSGLYIACEEVGEKTLAVELLPPDLRGTGMGLLAATNGIGDFISSAMVGTLWTILPGHLWVGFLVAAVLQLAGAGVLAGLQRQTVFLTK
ncbi:MAG: MFS transporter [Thermoanaerobaculia bacterium]